MPTDSPAAPSPAAPTPAAPSPAAPSPAAASPAAPTPAAPSPAGQADDYGPPPPFAPELRGLARISEDDEFRRRFPDETACRDFLFRARWPQGFVCTKCRGRSFRWLTSRAFQCRCRKKFSLTAGTVLHGTRKELQYWFLAAHLVSRTGMNAKRLAKAVKLTYKIAWAWGQKLRGLMAGITTLDEPDPPHDPATYSPFHRGQAPPRLVLQRWGADHGLFRWEAIREGGFDNCCQRLVTRDWNPSRFSVHGMYVGNAVRDLKCTYSGHVSDKHLRCYLDETEFRRNHRNMPQGRAAMKIVERFPTSSPVSYRRLTGRRLPPVITFCGALLSTIPVSPRRT